MKHRDKTEKQLMQELMEPVQQPESELVKAERKQLEYALLKNREAFQIISERTSHLIVTIDSAGNCVHCNNAMLQFLECTRDELLTKNLRDLISPGKERQGVEEHRPLLKSGGTKEVQHRVNGKVKTLKLTFSPAIWQGQRVAFCIGEDITEHKLAQEALKVSEERYRSLTEGVLDSSSVGLFILDSDFRVVWINHAMEQFFGLNRDKVIGMDKKRLVQRRIKHLLEDPESFAEQVLAAYKDNTYIANFECHVLGNDEREERWLEHWSQPIKFGVYAGGRAEYYYDVTQRKHMEEALRQSEEKSRTMLGHMNEGYYEVDLASNLTFFNETYCQGLGYSREELIGANYRRVTFEEDAERMYQLFLQMYRTGEPVDGISCRAVRKDGSILLIESSASPLRNGRGEIIGFRGIGRDITKQRRMEQQLDGLVKNTFNAQEAERERICLDVHDGVTQTMASAFQHLQTLGVTLPEDIPGQQLLLKAESLVKQSIRESREVINSLQPATLKDLGLILTLRQEMRQLRRETGWRVSFSGNVTKLPSTIEMGLYRIIGEALANIRKHAKSKHVRVEITSANGQVTVWVKDWGIGFDSEHIDTGERKGIGLLSMRKRAELLQGTCDIQSTLGQGTTVCVKIPINDFGGGEWIK